MYGYNAGPPMAIPIYTVLPYCVMHSYEPVCAVYALVHAVHYIYYLQPHSEDSSSLSMGMHTFNNFCMHNL